MTVTTMQLATILLVHIIVPVNLVSMETELCASISMNVCISKTIVIAMLSARMFIPISSANVNRVLTVTV